MKGLLITTLLHSLLFAIPGTAWTQEAGQSPDIVALAQAGDESRLLEEVRARPDDTRDALDQLFQLTVQAKDAMDRVQFLERAQLLAQAYAQAWSDSFLIRKVERFTRWSSGERADKLEADSVRRAGIEAYYREGPEAAIRLWERSLTLCRALEDTAGQAAVLGNLGAGYYALGDLERALRYHERALELALAAADHRTRGNALGNIASLHKDRGAFAEAAEYYERALEARELTGDRRGKAADLNNLGLVREALGDLQGAEEHFRRALELNRHDGRERAAANNLTNLANLATRRGHYDEALDLYNEALALRVKTGDRQGEALDLQNLGLLHLSWGDYPAALQSLQASLAILEELGITIWRAEVRADIAAVYTAMGKLQDARAGLTQAIAEAGGAAYLGPALAMQRADLMTELNELDRAAQLYQEAETAYEQLGDVTGQAEAETGLGYLYLTRGDYDAAEEAFGRTLRVHENLGDARPAATARLRLGDARFLRGDTAAARRTYHDALAAYQALGDPVGEAVTRGALADLDLELRAFSIAEAGYTAALDRLRGLPVRPARWYLRLGRGRALHGQGRLDEAAAELRAAVDDVEAIGATMPTAERRYAYMEDKWRVYSELAQTELDRGRPAAAFETSERLRARQLVDLLGRGRTGAPSPEFAMVREEENLRRRITLLSDELYASSSEVSLRDVPTTSGQLDTLRGSLAAARERYERLLSRLEESRPEYAALFSGSVATVAHMQRLLPAGAVLVEYLVSDEWTIAFVVSNDGVAGSKLPVGRNTVRQLTRFLRGTLGPSDEGELWRTPLRRLYHELIAPLEAAGHLDGAQLLVFAPHAELHYLPFQALLRPGPQGERFLIESYDVAYTPSASVWAELARRDPALAGRGTLAMAPKPDVLANSADEVQRVSRGDTAAEVVIGSRATESLFRELAPDRDVLYLATLGVLNTRNPLFSHVQLNPDETSDGRLEAHEVFGLQLSADLLVLSACETGLGSGLRHDVPPGDDWVGLVRAFLYAGARSVVASLWPVDDRATATLMEKFYTGLQNGRPKARSLADAQRAMLREPGHANPFYWAAFQLSGGVE
ncbi:MAG: CHAT domain-containing protein [Gemmatimonadales bacterium]|jgi:CHAT domain-containing protein/tetratricopeptide (TPR) repeat protein